MSAVHPVLAIRIHPDVRTRVRHAVLARPGATLREIVEDAILQALKVVGQRVDSAPTRGERLRPGPKQGAARNRPAAPRPNHVLLGVRIHHEVYASLRDYATKRTDETLAEIVEALLLQWLTTFGEGEGEDLVPVPTLRPGRRPKSPFPEDTYILVA